MKLFDVALEKGSFSLRRGLFALIFSCISQVAVAGFEVNVVDLEVGPFSPDGTLTLSFSGETDDLIDDDILDEAELLLLTATFTSTFFSTTWTYDSNALENPFLLFAWNATGDGDEGSLLSLFVTQECDEFGLFGPLCEEGNYYGLEAPVGLGEVSIFINQTCQNVPVEIDEDVFADQLQCEFPLNDNFEPEVVAFFPAPPPDDNGDGSDVPAPGTLLLLAAGLGLLRRKIAASQHQALGA